jgi:myo-inositol-1(or 4)-monophosphatase
MTFDLVKIKRLLIKITKEAGAYALANFSNKFEVEYKGPGKTQPVTVVDVEIDAFLRKQITNAFPTHSIQSEELPNHRGLNKKILWVIDPIDGSRNYINGKKLYSVSIAVIVSGQTVMGTIYSPALKKFYFVEKGKGVSLNGKKIKQQASKSNICFFRDQPVLIKKASKLFPGVELKREHLHCTSIDFTRIAEGKAKCAIYNNINLYDFAAGCLMVEEMGGKVMTFNGKPYSIRSKNLVIISKNTSNKLQVANKSQGPNFKHKFVI